MISASNVHSPAVHTGDVDRPGPPKKERKKGKMSTSE